MFDPVTLFVILATFLLAGTVKGVIGLGLPTVSLGILAIALDLTSAIALLLVPSLATNIWQAAVGGHARAILRRIWPFLTVATLTVWIGASALTRIDLDLLSALLGVLLVAYAGVSLIGFRPTFTARQETRAGPALGLANGILTGMTGSFVVPSVMYLQAIGLERDAMVQAMGILFTCFTLALAVSLQGYSLLTAQLGLLSAAGLIPALAGMVLGQAIRQRLSEDVFRRVFFWGLLLLGAYIIGNAVLGGH